MKPTRLLAAVLLAGAARPAHSQPIGTEFRVNTVTTGGQDSGGVAIDTDGSFVVAWRGHAYTLEESGARGQRFGPSGNPAGIEFRATPMVTTEPFVNGGVTVAKHSSGSFVVVWGWAYTAGTDLGVFGQRYDAAGAPLGTWFRINTYTTANQSNPHVHEDANGNFVVSWVSKDEDGDLNGVFARRYSASGAALGDGFRVNTYTTNHQHSADVAVSPNGDFVIVWTSLGQESAANAFGQRFAASGAPLGGEFRVNTYHPFSYSGNPVVAASSNGFVVVWRTDYGSVGNEDVIARRFDAGGVPRGSELRVNTTTSGYQTWLSVAAAGNAGFVVVWVAGPLNDNLVLGRRLSSTGALVGVEFRVSTNTTNHKFYSQVAANGDGRFVATWVSKAQTGGHQYDVFGQVFGPVSSLRGDADGSGAVNVSDILYLINDLFAGGPAPVTACGGDADSSNTTNVSDVLFLINYLFAGGPTPGPC